MSTPSVLLSAAQASLRAGAAAEAARHCDEVLRQQPDHPEALFLRGQAALQTQDAPGAAAVFGRLAELHPGLAAAHLHHGIALRRLHENEAALAAFRRAVAGDPRLAEAHHQLGNLLKALGRIAEAVACLGKATALAPDRAVLWLNYGVASLDGGDVAGALGAFDRAVALEPSRPESHNIRGHALATAGRSTEARESFEKALQLRPGYAAAHDNLGRLCKAEGRLDEAVTHFRAALAAAPSPTTHSNLLLALNYLPDADPAAVLAEHRRWQDLYAASPSPPAPTPAPRLGRRLRIGFLSPDFAHHAVAYFLEPVLGQHDRQRVEVFGYANVRTPDRVTTHLRSLAEHWRDVAWLDDAAAADLIRADRLDLLIDLAGHTAHHRLGVMALRPAPVQATWLGYPNTTGLSAIDYRLTDALCDPPGTTEAFHSEKLVRLPNNFSCYQPPAEAPAVGPLPAAQTGTFTFGCLNNFAKVTPAVRALWTTLLQRVPSSRLLLKLRGQADQALAARLAQTFALDGIARERLTFHCADLPVAEHLALYQQIDVALDPFPYHGTTTTCEALWMGVPVVTLAGRVHAARVGVSLLTNVGLADWITTTPADYVARAAGATTDLTALAELRAGLRSRMRASPLCAAAAFTAAFEDACEAMALRQA